MHNSFTGTNDGKNTIPPVKVGATNTRSRGFAESSKGSFVNHPRFVATRPCNEVVVLPSNDVGVMPLSVTPLTGFAQDTQTFAADTSIKSRSRQFVRVLSLQVPLNTESLIPKKYCCCDSVRSATLQ